MRDTLLIIHVLAAGAWIGTNVVQFVVNPTIAAKGTAIAADWHRTVVGFGTRIYTPAALTLLVTGIVLLTAVDDSPYEFSDPFVSIGFTAVLIGAVMGVKFFAPNGRRAADAYEAGDVTTAAAFEKRLRIGGALDTVVILVTVAAMVAKWGV